MGVVHTKQRHVVSRPQPNTCKSLAVREKLAVGGVWNEYGTVVATSRIHSGEASRGQIMQAFGLNARVHGLWTSGWWWGGLKGRNVVRYVYSKRLFWPQSNESQRAKLEIVRPGEKCWCLGLRWWWFVEMKERRWIQNELEHDDWLRSN